jgi:glycosyltransferase involved in cell wall biosynthesis
VLLLIAKAFGKPVVIFMHGWDESFERRFLKRVPWLFRALYGRADCFIVLAGEFENRLRSIGYSKAIFRLAAPVEDEILQNFEDRVDAGRFATNGCGFRILFLARVERTKGIYEALDAYGIVKQSFPSASLVIAGDGSELKSAAEYVRTMHLADVTFRGHVGGAEKLEIFKTADIYLFPSYTEGMPISVLEAMACGLPVVTSAVGGLRDFFENGRMGYMSQNVRPATLASLICQLMRDPHLCSQIRSFNSQYARRHFGARQIAAQLEHVYRSMLGMAH